MQRSSTADVYVNTCVLVSTLCVNINDRKCAELSANHQRNYTLNTFIEKVIKLWKKKKTTRIAEVTR